MYRKMQPYPSQQDHMYQGPHCYPGMETFPTQGYVNPVRPPMGCGWWPWGSGYGGASPMPNHGCCNHSYIPAHGAWGSPYSHATVHKCPGNYPSFPVQYMPPPPYYANMPGEHHCCGCFNHPLHHGGQKNVRIEEEEPERERRKDSPVAPWVFHNVPDRIGWLPPENKEQGMVKETGDMRDGSPDVKANEKGKVAAQQPTFQNGWFPLDLNNLVLPKSKGDGEGNKQDDGKTNIPYPLFWIPYKHEGNEKEDLKEKAARLESEAGGELRPNTNRESIGDRAATKARDIPVKEAEQPAEKVILKKEKDASDGEKKVDKGDKVSPKEGSKRESSAPKKLAPVCLRVDPLPKIKKGNGSSQSPSPLSNKQKLDSQSNDAGKVLNPLARKEQAKILPDKEDRGTKTIEVVDGSTSQENTVDVKNNNSVKNVVESQADVSTKGQSVESQADVSTKGQSEDSGLAREKNEVSSQAQDMKADEVEKSCKTSLSEEEAAVIIQSAYRGFDVRRWEPIKKLKQIAAVREQIADVKHLIQAMKSSFDFQARSKQRNIVAETIMSLLLKLDTIQGLAPSIREVRKSVVRELVNLQEQLDSLMNEELENSPGPESSKACDEDALITSEDLITSQNDHETTPTDVSDAHQDQTDGGANNDNSNLIGKQASEKIEKDTTASCTDKCVESAPEPTNKEDEKKSNEVVMDDETIADKAPEPTNKEDEKSNEVVMDDETIAEKAPEPSNEEDEKSNEVVMDDETIAEKAPEPSKEEDEKSNEVVIDDDIIAEKATEPSDKGEKSNEVVLNDETTAENDHEDLVVGQGSGISLHEDSSSAKATDITATDHESVGSELTKLPVVVLDDFCAEEGPNDVLAEVDVNGGDQEKQQLVGVSIESSIVSEPHETAENKDISQPMQTHEVLDLPFNIVEPNSEETSPIGRTLDGKFGTEEEVDGKTGNARIELDYTVQQQQNFNSDMIEMPSHLLQVPKSIEMPSHLLQVPKSIEMPSHLLQVPNSKQETSLISGSANSDEMGAEAKSDDKRIDSDSTRQSTVDEESQPQITQACQLDDQVSVNVPEECNTKQPTPTETPEEQGLKDASLFAVDDRKDSPARDGVMESNRRLSEENERLRNMMEKLIKSGQEQLLAISSLSERVKDMEKKLSRKKKLKVKQYRGPRSGSSCMTKYDDKSSVGSAM